MKRRKSTKKARRPNRVATRIKHTARSFRESLKTVLIWIGVFAVLYLFLIWR